MVEKFAFWLESIVEDFPVPDEILTIVFNVKFNGKYKYIEMFGFEENCNLNQLTYYPEEAQFFDCKKLKNCELNIFIKKIKYLISESFSSEILKYNFKQRKIYILHNELEYLFSV